MEDMEQQKTRRAFLGALGALSAFGLVRALPACSGSEEPPIATLRKTKAAPVTPPTDDDEHVPGEGDAPANPDQGQIGNAIWEDKAKKLESSNVGGTAYTQTSPGPFAGKEKSHVPTLTIQSDGVAMVLVNHVMDAGAAGAQPEAGRDAAGFDSGARATHYVTTVWVKDDKGRVVYFKELASTDIAPPVIAFKIPEGTKGLRAYEHCNLHGVWASAELAP